MNKSVSILLSTAALLVATGSMANAATPGAYLGGGIGVSGMKDAPDFQMKSDSGLAGRAFAGYNFNRYFGLEGAYSTFYKTTYVLNDFQTLSIDYKLNALSLVAKGYIPLSQDNTTNLYGLLGVSQSYADIDAKYHQTNLFSDSDTGVVPVLGLGASYDINKHFTSSLEASFFGKKDGDVSHFGIQQAALVTLNLAYKI